MILVIDVGNINIELGVYDGENLEASWRMTTIGSRTADETGMLIYSFFEYSHIPISNIESAVISSVVPDIMYSLTNGVRKYLHVEPMMVGAGMKTGINLLMDNPKEMGANRIVNLVAALNIYGGPVLVVDYNTATVFDVVSAKGEFLTGITAPGIQICADALYRKAAQLPRTEIKRPKTIIATNTIGSIQAGIVYGHIGETIYIISEIKRKLKMPNLKVVATGGMARIIDEKEEIFDVYDPVLSLKGLRLLYEKNKNRGVEKHAFGN